MSHPSYRLRAAVRVCAAALLVTAFSASSIAALYYEEDFSDTSEWFPVYNQNGDGSAVTTDGTSGALNVPSANNVVAFAPVFPLVTTGTFNPNASYLLTYTVTGVTYSTSYSIEIDEFDENQQYIQTTFNIIPQGVFVGTQSKLLNISWHPSTEYILPKVTVRTGDGGQAVYFDNLEIRALPEPASFMMLIVGMLLVSRRTRKAILKTDK